MGLDSVLKNVQTYAAAASVSAQGGSAHQRVIEGGVGASAREHTRALDGTTDALKDLKQSLDQSAVGKRVSRPPPLPGAKGRLGEFAIDTTKGREKKDRFAAFTKAMNDMIAKPLKVIATAMIVVSAGAAAARVFAGGLLKAQEGSRIYDAQSATAYAKLDRARLVNDVFLARASRTSRTRLINEEISSMRRERGARARLDDWKNFTAQQTRFATSHALAFEDAAIQAMQDALKAIGINTGMGAGGAVASPFDEFTKKMRDPGINIPPQFP